MYQTIILASCLGQTAEGVAKKAKVLADDTGAQLHLLHVVEPLPAYGDASVGELKSPVIDKARAALSELAQTLGLAAEHCHLEVGKIKKEINKLAQKLPAQLIIAGRHSSHGIAGILGSTASSLAHSAPCDVLLINES